MIDPEPRASVLVADDDPDVLFAVSELLRAAGFRVETARDGKDALRRVAADDFDVVLSDIMMPDMNGIELLRRVRAHDLDLPVVLMTGQPRMETAIQAVEHGALRYLLKPLSGEELTEAVDSAVRLHRVARWKREALVYLGADKNLVGDQAGLEANLKQAVESLWLAYQPIVEAQSGSVYGHEALVRTPVAALPRPTALFEAAERLDSLQLLGRAIRSKAAHTWSGSNGTRALFVNLHPADLKDEELFAGSAPLSRLAGKVVLEITERSSLWNVPDVKSRIQQLRSMGYRIAVDDLGAGYAGLTSFAALEPDVVKLDMSIVRGVDGDPIRRKLVSSMASLCKELNVLVVAEGVETARERSVLVDLGCDLLQGFLIGEPSR
jgi:EAL domain-containing protein (putative c-di-GMP-specific phosphodiesterase class I)/CheY-like chemotaxis protein